MGVKNGGRARNSSTIGDLSWVTRTRRPRSDPKITREISVVDLFSGCGCMTLGIWEAARRNGRKLNLRLAVDLNPVPLSVMAANFTEAGTRIQCGDVSEMFDGVSGSPKTIAENQSAGAVGCVDIIVAGPPCQGHSDLNNSTRRRDPRNALYLRVARAVEVLRPTVVLIENVPAVQHDSLNVIDRATKWLERLNYSVASGVVLMSEFGVPQLRKRHVILGLREQSLPFELQLTTGRNPTAGDYLSGLEDEPQKRDGILYGSPQMSAENRRRVNYLFDNELYDLPNAERPSCHRDKPHAYISMYGRMHWDKPAQTLTSGFGSMGQGRYVHPTKRRLITPHEAARLQGIPDFYDLSAINHVTHLREMIANAVPPQFTAIIVARLIDAGVI